MSKRQNSITTQITSDWWEFPVNARDGGKPSGGGFPVLFLSHSGLWEKMTHGSVSSDQWPLSSARRLSCQDNCCQDMLVFLGNNFSVLFLYSKPSPMSIVKPTWEAIRILAPCGNWEMVGRENKSSYQRGICSTRRICSNFMVCHTVHTLCKQRSQNPELGASSSREIKMNSQAYNTLKKYLVGNGLLSLGDILHCNK